MPVDRFGIGLQSGMPGLTRLAQALAGGDQSVQQGYLQQASGMSKIAQELAAARASSATAAENEAKARLLAGRPDAYLEQAALQSGTDVPTINAFRQSVQTGQMPQVDLQGPATPEGGQLTGPAVGPELRSKIATALQRLAPMGMNTGDIGMSDLAKAMGAYQDQDRADQVRGGAVSPAVAGQQEAALKGSPLVHFPEGVGGNLFSGDVSTSMASRGKPTELSRLMTERDALPPGDPGRRVYDAQIQKLTTHAPPVSVSVNTEKSLLGTIGDKLGGDIVNQSEIARDAQGTIDTAGRIRAALQSNKAITGTAATPRLMLAQLGNTLGLGPAGDVETLAKTRELMMALGDLELKAASQMKGQGQITQAERDLLKRAAAGDINFTPSELQQVANAAEKNAKARIARNATNVKLLKSMPNAAAVVPFLDANGQPSGGPDAPVRMPTSDEIAAEAARRAAQRGR